MSRKPEKIRKFSIEENLKETLSQLRMAEMEVDDLKAQVDELENKIELPKLKKQLEGKYFKYNNGYDRDRRWWLYTKVLQVKAVNKIIVDYFETEAYGKNNFQHGRPLSGTTTIGTQISKREYYAAMRKFKNNLSKLK